MLKIICIGKKHEDIYSDAIAHFEVRLKPFVKLEWRLLPHSSLDGDQARKEESVRILNSITPDENVLLLDETGKAFGSPDIASLINTAQNSSKDIVIIIGGAYGVDDSVKKRADQTISFGKAVFPHQLMRVMVLEQCYRAYSILAGSKYHHE